MTPEEYKALLPKKRRHQEDQIHIGIVHRLRKDFDERDLLFLHAPNGGRRNKREAAKLKAMGVKAGTPDLLLWWTAWTQHNIYASVLQAGAIEIKAPKGVLTPEQKGWRDSFLAKGGRWALCRDYESVKATLINWGVKQR